MFNSLCFFCEIWLQKKTKQLNKFPKCIGRQHCTHEYPSLYQMFLYLYIGVRTPYNSWIVGIRSLLLLSPHVLHGVKTHKWPVLPKCRSLVLGMPPPLALPYIINFFYYIYGKIFWIFIGFWQVIVFTRNFK
jgi:hypothetical protein